MPRPRPLPAHDPRAACCRCRWRCRACTFVTSPFGSATSGRSRSRSRRDRARGLLPERRLRPIRRQHVDFTTSNRPVRASPWPPVRGRRGPRLDRRGLRPQDAEADPEIAPVASATSAPRCRGSCTDADDPEAAAVIAERDAQATSGSSVSPEWSVDGSVSGRGVIDPMVPEPGDGPVGNGRRGGGQGVGGGSRGWDRCRIRRPEARDGAGERPARPSRRRRFHDHGPTLARSPGGATHDRPARFEGDRDRAVDVRPIDPCPGRREPVDRRPRRVPVGIAGPGRGDRDQWPDRGEERLVRRGPAAVVGDLQDVDPGQARREQGRVDLPPRRRPSGGSAAPRRSRAARPRRC